MARILQVGQAAWSAVSVTDDASEARERMACIANVSAIENVVYNRVDTLEILYARVVDFEY